MISFRNSKEIGTSVAMLLAAVALLGVLIFMLVVKPPKPVMSRNQREAERVKIEVAKNDAEEKNAAAKEEIARWLWEGTAPQIGPLALARATELSKQHHLKLVTFRPDKAVDVGGLTQLPFQMSISGKFPDVAALLKDLETPSERLSVNLVQIAAGEGVGDEVTATIGTIAFIQPGPVATTSASKSTHP